MAHNMNTFLCHGPMGLCSACIKACDSLLSIRCMCVCVCLLRCGYKRIPNDMLCGTWPLIIIITTVTRHAFIKPACKVSTNCSNVRPFLQPNNNEATMARLLTKIYCFYVIILLNRCATSDNWRLYKHEIWAIRLFTRCLKLTLIQ